MKKTVSVLAAVAVVAGASMAFAVGGDSNIKNSKHNIPQVFSAATQGTTSQICVYCHTPHNAAKAIPLWNRNTNIAAGSFVLYSSQTMSNSVRKTGFTTDSISLFCMSCHDGATMGGSMVINKPKNGSVYDATASDVIASTKANFGGNLSTTHPVNFNLENRNTGGSATFSSTGQMRNDGKSDLVWASGNTYMGTNSAGTFPLFKSTRGDYSVECSSCHAVHDDYFAPFLRSTMNASALCLGCHRK